MLTQAWVLVQFAVVMLSIGMLPDLSISSGPLMLALLVGAGLLAASVPVVIRHLCRALLTRQAVSSTAAAPSAPRDIALPTEPGVPGAVRARAPAQRISASA